ncbi:MAG: DUF899 family protein [Granulosicoccaceae bacterium]
MAEPTAQELEYQIYELATKLNEKRKQTPGTQVSDYTFDTNAGPQNLSSFFGNNSKLLVIHNMGQACRFCTLWGDGISAFLPHLESAMSLVMVSKDSPEQQRIFANSRGWRMRMASHNGGDYMTEQIAAEGMGTNMPGAACYEKQGDKIVKTNSSFFGPNDLYCPMWHFLGMAGITHDEWTPQYNYWVRPSELEDGGENVLG